MISRQTTKGFAGRQDVFSEHLRDPGEHLTCRGRACNSCGKERLDHVGFHASYRREVVGADF